MAIVCHALWRRIGRPAFQTPKAFWLKQGSAGLIVGALLFLGSVVIGKPMMKFFVTQVFQPDTPDKEGALKLLYAYSDMKRGLIIATLIIGFETSFWPQSTSYST